MNIFDSREAIGEIDVSDVLGSVDALGRQCRHAWEDVGNVAVPDSYRNVDSLVMCGMGGSGLGARVIESLYADTLKIPLVRVNTYNLPGFVNERTLVVCSSYSGTTEETIANAKQAIAGKSKWMAIGTGNTLITMAAESGVPYYRIDPQFNPSNQPRMAVGYSIVGQLGLVSRAGVIDVADEQLVRALSAMKNITARSAAGVPTRKNPAKQIAAALRGKIVVFVSAEHTAGAAHTMNNQLNENAKHFSSHVSIPELNHHLMEGLKHPPSNKKNVLFVFVRSQLYPERIRRRVEITQDVVKKNGIETVSIDLAAPSKLSQAFELIQIGGYISVYLSLLYRQNPEPVPWVDYFKKKLSRQPGT